MRHVPEDELHAYLDQALSRSQAIEIETHLARCLPCCRHRDAIANLRDRTTALLTRVAPRLAVPPPYATLLVQVAERRKISGRRAGLLAASLAGALFAGWAVRSALDPHEAVVPVAAEAAAPAGTELAAAEPTQLPAREPGAQEPVATIRVDNRPLPADPMVRFAGAAESEPETSHQPAPVTGSAGPATPVLDAGWNPVDPGAMAGDLLLPIIPGAAVNRVWVLDLGPDLRPAVFSAQRTQENELIYLIEGPVSQVADLVAAQLGPSVGLSASDPARAPPDYLPSGSGIRRQSRVLAVVGAFPVEALNALARRVVLR